MFYQENRHNLGKSGYDFSIRNILLGFSKQWKALW